MSFYCFTRIKLLFLVLDYWIIIDSIECCWVRINHRSRKIIGRFVYGSGYLWVDHPGSTEILTINRMFDSIGNCLTKNYREGLNIAKLRWLLLSLVLSTRFFYPKQFIWPFCRGLFDFELSQRGSTLLVTKNWAQNLKKIPDVSPELRPRIRLVA